MKNYPVIFLAILAAFSSPALAEKPLPWQAPPAVLTPPGKFFPINPASHMRAPTPRHYYALPPQSAPSPHAGDTKDMTEEQAKQLLSIYSQ